MRNTDPAAMTELERFAELAELLARGVQRYFANGCKARLAPEDANNCRNRLDAVRTAEAPCCSRVQSPQSKTPA